MMNLKELHDLVAYAHDTSISNVGINPKDIVVAIDLTEPSYGARSATGIASAGMGFDWEHGQFRITPAEKLVRLGNAITDSKPVVCKQIEGKNTFWCPRCESKIAGPDRYCRYCGQKLVAPNKVKGA